jgi:proteasomal ATPase-associated factor 1
METFPLCLPVVTIQPSFTEVIKEVQDGIIPSENFWVSCYKNLETSLHGKVKVELDDVDRNLIKTRTIEGDVEVTRNFEGVSESYLVLGGTPGQLILIS